jgi:hypothetical protein
MRRRECSKLLGVNEEWELQRLKPQSNCNAYVVAGATKHKDCKAHRQDRLCHEG